jgi:hypothetical protein
MMQCDTLRSFPRKRESRAKQTVSLVALGPRFRGDERKRRDQH